MNLNKVWFHVIDQFTRFGAGSILTSALHASRKAFTEAECSERIRTALCKQLRQTHEKYEMGDEVYCKRVDRPEWKGPVVGIGQDVAVVFVRH